MIDKQTNRESKRERERGGWERESEREIMLSKTEMKRWRIIDRKRKRERESERDSDKKEQDTYK